MDEFNKQVKEQNDKIENLKREKANLENLKSDQKATLNFYLEEADIEPFLTTKITIPFPTQPSNPAVITKPPTPPAP